MEPFSKVKGDLIKMAVDFDSKAYLERLMLGGVLPTTFSRYDLFEEQPIVFSN